MKFCQKMRLIFLCLLFIAGFNALNAQKDGWQFIQKDDWQAAKTAFDAELRLHPTDEQALIGRLFLSETTQNVEEYSETANKLINLPNHPEYVALFGQMFEGDAATIANRSDLPEVVKMPFAMSVADTFFYLRQFEKYRNQLAANVQDFNWAVLGSFQNVSGSGHITEFEPESAKFDLKTNFLTTNNLEIGWLKNQNRETDGRCSFARLVESRGLTTNFANTFITVPTAREGQIRIRRGTPMKIWLDDQLIADLPEQAAFRWDLEQISVKLAAGTHRILVKCSQFPSSNADSKLSLDFNDHRNDGASDYFDYSNGGSDGGETEFSIRLTDVEGRIFRDLKSDFDGKYTPAVAPIFSKMVVLPYLEFFQKKVAKTGKKANSDFYLLSKAFLKYKKEEAGEAFFVENTAKMEGTAFFNFLIAKFYHENGKGEKAESLLSTLDTLRTPTFAWSLKKLDEIDPTQKESEFVAGLENLLLLSPNNWSIMRRYLDFLKEKGRREAIELFVKRQLVARGKDKKWHDRLDDYLKNESYRPETTKEITDKQRLKQYKSAQKNLKKRVDYVDYNLVIDYLKQKDKDAEVLAIMDEILEFQPWSTGWHFQRAQFLFEKNRLDEALVECEKLETKEPYSVELHELMGDIWLEKKDKTAALNYYKKAKKWSGESAYGISEKIEKIENRRKFTQFFEPINLDNLVKKVSWKAKYADEESVISHFSSQCWLNEDGQMEMLNRLIIHIQSQEGARMWTEGDYGILGNITSAKVIKPNGTTSSPELGYGGVAVFKNLNPGDIITMEGTNNLPMPDEIAGEFLMFDVLPFKVPVVEARLELLLPKDTIPTFACNRIDCQPTITDAGEGFKKYDFLWKNLPKTDESEGGAPNNLDRFPWFMASSATDWRSVVDWYLQKTYRRTLPNYQVLAKIREIVQPEMTEQQKVNAIYEFVTREVKYSFVSFLNSNYTPNRPSETISGSIGDCKDVATLMISMLREVGIPAWHTLVSTHNFSNKEPRPTLYVFNHAIAAWQSSDGALHFLDLTTDYFPPNVLPEQDNDAWGLLIRAGETQLRRLPNDAMNVEKSRIELVATAQVELDRSLKIEAKTTMIGVVAGKFREIINSKSVDDRRKFLGDYFGGGAMSNLSFEKFGFDSLDNLAAPLRANFSIRAFNQVDKVSNFHIIPLPLPLSMPARRELFAEKRYNDLDLNDLLEVAPVRETVEVTLPAGWQLMDVPKNVVKNTEFGDYRLQFEQKNANSLTITRELMLKKLFIAHEDYEKFKAFYLEISDADGTKLAIKER